MVEFQEMVREKPTLCDERTTILISGLEAESSRTEEIQETLNIALLICHHQDYTKTSCL